MIPPPSGASINAQLSGLLLEKRLGYRDPRPHTVPGSPVLLTAAAGPVSMLSGTKTFTAVRKIHYTHLNPTRVGSATAPAAPTAAAPSAGGSVTSGTHLWACSFVTYGVESQLSPASTSQTTGSGNNTVALSGIPTGPQGTTARKIYRTLAGAAGPFYLVATLADNTTTTYTDTTADTALLGIYGNASVTIIAGSGGAVIWQASIPPGGTVDYDPGDWTGAGEAIAPQYYHSSSPAQTVEAAVIGGTW
jgi:hypothetical protein